MLLSRRILFVSIGIVGIAIAGATVVWFWRLGAMQRHEALCRRFEEALSPLGALLTERMEEELNGALQELEGWRELPDGERERLLADPRLREPTFGFHAVPATRGESRTHAQNTWWLHADSRDTTNLSVQDPAITDAEPWRRRLPRAVADPRRAHLAVWIETRVDLLSTRHDVRIIEQQPHPLNEFTSEWLGELYAGSGAHFSTPYAPRPAAGD